ncbi:MAG TPA: hypothetical protein VFJ43_03420, partial [Bacteroidia bacterium]|nr:hypothetical protein [Bacteroidia bacterium]
MKNFLKFFLPTLFGASLVAFFSYKTSPANNIADLIEIDNTTKLTTYQIQSDNDRMYNELKFFIKENADRTDTFPYNKRNDSLAYFNVFLKLKEQCSDLENFIIETRGKLVGREEGIKNHMGDTLRLSLLKNPMDTKSVNAYMIDSDKIADKIVLQISQLEDFLNSSHIFPVNQAPVRITGKDYFENYSNIGEKWELIIFKDRPLVYSILLLDSIKLDICKAENKALHKYVDDRWMHFVQYGCLMK